MKRMTTIVASLTLAISLTACTNNNSNKTDTPSTSDTTENVNEQNNEHAENDENDVESDEQDKLVEQINIMDDESLTRLVNKQNSLGENYIPEDLITVSVPTVLDNPEVKQMRKEAADALAAMFQAAELENIYLHARSGYRSYETQVQLFNNYVERNGEEAANRYSARPGHSEHQTGLVMDITSESVQYDLTEDFGNTEEGLWLKEHAHEFGFIIRYPEGQEEITGYIYEPWHVRYLGEDVATAVYESGLTYEQFLVEAGIIDDIYAEKTK